MPLIFAKERKFKDEEVRKAIFGCAPNKSTGPDGFSMAFFQYPWEIIKGDLMKVFEEFWHSGIINRFSIETYICSIHKKVNSYRVSDFRSISLITSVYKTSLKS